jgi:glycosyltransferase involved in cell wall biosynthesis
LTSGFEFICAGKVLVKSQFLKEKKWPITYLNHINKVELVEEYIKADILVFPTLSDGFGMVQLEAMSYGLPVIATDCCAEVVEDNISGFIIQPRSVESIIEKLLLIKEDQEKYDFLSSNARKRSQQFSLEKLATVFK